jgi:TonB family protein
MSGIASAFVIGIWLSGALLLLVRAAWQWSCLAKHARRSPRVDGGIVHDTLRRLERAESVGTPTAIVASRHAIEPGVIGIRRPVLIWPQHLTAGLTDTHIEAIVAHEIGHIVRRDNLHALVQIVVTAVFWFYPPVWWIGARLVDERERACDERVLAAGRRPETYAESILKTCQLCIASPLVNVSGVTGGNLKTRLVRIMKNAPAAPLGVGKKVAMVLTALLTAFAPIASGMSTGLTHQDRAVAAAQDPDTEVHRPGRNVVAPKLIREVKPQYTARAMGDKIEGEVLMECIVNADGTVGEHKIVKSLDPDLDQAALDAAAQWLFEPGTRDGKPVNVIVTITILFTLK